MVAVLFVFLADAPKSRLQSFNKSSSLAAGFFADPDFPLLPLGCSSQWICPVDSGSKSSKLVALSRIFVLTTLVCINAVRAAKSLERRSLVVRAIGE